VPTLDLAPDALLSTTRAVRKRLDLTRPVEMDVIRECLELALQAPTGSNAQGWHFVVVRDAEKRRRIGELYGQSFEAYRRMPQSAHQLDAGGDSAHAKQMERVISSAEYLAAHLGEVPVHLIACVQGRADTGLAPPMANVAQASLFGSILPAVWSFMLAARARGLATAWTTLHLVHEKTVSELLGIPYDEVTQVALVPVAYATKTDFEPARRKPLENVLHVDTW